MEISNRGNSYYNIVPNATLEKLYKNNGKALGIQFPENPQQFAGRWKSKIPKKGKAMELFSQRFYNYLAGSTDFGNVSFKIPGIHPFFYIGTDALNHTEEYTEAAGTSAHLRRGINMLFFLLMKVNCIRCFKSSSCFQVTWFVCLVFLFTSYPLCRRSFSFHARSWKGPVVHPEDSQGPGDDSCGRRVLPRSVAASERGLQAG